MEPLIARRSIRHQVGGVIVGAVMALVLYLLMGLRGGMVAGIAVICGSAVYGLVRAMTERSEVLRIDEAGILDRRSRFGPIPWNEVSGVRRYGGRLYVQVDAPGRLGLRTTGWSRLNRPLGRDGDVPGVMVGLVGLDVPADRICAAVSERLGRPGAGA